MLYGWLLTATGREHWIAALQAGQGTKQSAFYPSPVTAYTGLHDAPRPGAPPRTGGNPATARSAYLTQVKHTFYPRVCTRLILVATQVMKHAQKTGILAVSSMSRPAVLAVVANCARQHPYTQKPVPGSTRRRRPSSGTSTG